MYNITLLSSCHVQHGKCNSTELYNIIEKIEPEVIFEELPSDIFDIVYTEGHVPQSLEAIAIKRYLEKYSINHIAVDTHFVNELDLFKGHNIVANKNIEYLNLIKQKFSMSAQYGYSFLNSNAFIELIKKIQIIEKNTLLETNNIKLYNQYKTEIELHNKREIEMLENIYNYSKQHKYNKALFICGAEHREPIIQRIIEFENKGEIKLNWRFYNN